MKRNKTISSLEINDRKERLTPIGLITFYYITLLIFLHLQKDGVFVPPIIKAMVFGGTVSGIATFIITRKMKISFHSLGMGSLFGFLYMFSIPLSQPPVLVIVLVILSGGIVMTSRLILNAHTLKEIGWGYALGVVSQIICIYLYLKFI